VGYDTVRYVEPEKLPFAGAPGDDRGLPDLHLQLYRELVVFDHVNKTLLAITHTPAPDDGAGADGSERAAAEARLDELERLLLDPSADEGHRLPAGSIEQVPGPPTMPTSSMGDRGYREAVRRVKQYVAAGDAFQVVPSQRFELRSGVDPFEAYRALRVVNPSPYMFYLQARGAVLVGSSPEILVRVESAGAGEVEGLDEPVRRHLGEPDAAAGEHKRVTSRPLAGTRKRGATAQQDAALEAELLADPKDRAEHVMLVDLHRNDIGRLASPGTIELPELFAVERYSHVMHLSSTVSGLMRRGLTCWDALRYSLPVGTVSGAPKVRAMQIIDELEPTRRGPYAGAVGHADLAGNLDMCIALRTMVVLPPPAPGSGAGDGQCQLSDTAGGSGDGGQWTYHLQAGGGIVADSDPDAEHEETVHKAAALARAIALAEQAFGKAEG
jgi:anthranilate synthase component 1